MKNKEDEAPAMKTMTKLLGGVLVLVVLLPALVQALHELLLPFLVVVLVLLVARVVWFHTRM